MSCQHERFEAYVEVTRVVSDQDKRVTLGFVVDVRARCASCQQELEFIGLPVGISSFGPTCSPDGVEARLNAKLKEVPNSLVSGGVAPIITPPMGSA